MRIFIIFFLSLNCFAVDSIYEDLFLGEQDFSEYQGPIDPAIIKKKYSDRPLFIDDVIRKDYLENRTNPQLFSLINFISDDLSLDARCPNYQLEKNLGYIRYLYRLISISYLFENLKELWVDSYNLGFGNFCSLEWKKTFGHCRAVTIDMANFVKRIEGKHLKDFSKLRLKRMKKSARQDWIKKFRAKKKNLTVSEARVNLFCQENGIDCRKIDHDSLKFAFQLSCTQDEYTLINICSGYDGLYGLSNVPEAYNLLIKSEAFKFIDKEGYGKECLKRYSKLFIDKEIPSEVLATIFPKVEKLMKEDKRVYPQGSLFISGSFKQFDSKGLEGFLFPKDQEKSSEIKNREIELSKNLGKIKKQEDVFVLKDPTSKNLNVLAASIKTNSQVKNTKKRREPQFKKIEMKRFLIGADKLPIDMGKFKRDFIFINKMDEDTMQKIKAYSSLEILGKLKKTEGYGTFENPFSLTFLKFLLDLDFNTELGSITKLYKERLYVLNDLVGPRKVSYIELKKLDMGWQIYILKQKVKPSKAPKFKTK